MHLLYIMALHYSRLFCLSLQVLSFLMEFLIFLKAEKVLPF